MSMAIMHGSSGLSPESGLMARTWDLEGEYRRRIVAAVVPFDADPVYAETSIRAIGFMQDLILRCVVNPAIRPSSAEDNSRKLLNILNDWRAGYCPGIGGMALATVEIEDPRVFARVFATGSGKVSTSGENPTARHSFATEEILLEPDLPYMSYKGDSVTQNNIKVSSNFFALRVSAGDGLESTIDEELSAAQVLLPSKAIPGAFIMITQD